MIFVLIGLAVVLYALYYAFTIPLNRIRRLGDVGFYFGKPELSGRYREQQLERLKKLRQVGELPPVYPNGWFCIAESNEIGKGEIKPIHVFGQRLTLVRGAEDGVCRLIDSYCPHLGANFNVGGRVVDNNCVQCPFHGWVFSSESGKCTRIPYNSGSIPDQAKVSVWPVCERNKHVYVWYHCDGHDPEWEIPSYDEVANGTFWFQGRTEHEVMCHNQEIPENGADIAHLGFLHNSGVQRGFDITSFDLSDLKPAINHVWDGDWAARTGDEQHISVMRLDQYMELWGVRIPLSSSNLKAIQIGPGIVHMEFSFGALGSGVVLHHVTPEEPLLQRARFVMYSNLPRWFSKFFMWTEANQFERDVYVWSNKRYVKNVLLVKNDGPIGKHRRWFSQFYSENSPRLLKDGTVSGEIKSVLDW